MSRDVATARRSLVARTVAIGRRFELLQALTKREVQVRYKQAFLGMAWAVFMPFSLMLIFVALKGNFVPKSGEEEVIPYAVWSYCGLLVWTMHQTALKGATNTLVANKNLLSKIYFPRELFPLSKIGAAVVDFGVGLTVLVGLMLWFDVPFQPAMLMLPLVLFVHMLLLVGVGFLLSAANLFFRDVQYVFDVFVLLWMFASPVFAPMPLDPDASTTLVVLAHLNPMHPILTGYRAVLVEGGFDAEVLRHFLFGTCYVAALFLVGFTVFARAEPKFAERV